MNMSRREESFRYQFSQPLKGKFQMTKINGVKVESHYGELDILDLSLNGARIATEYDIHYEGKEVEVTLIFQIMTVEWSIPGKIIYRKPHAHNCIYGIHLDTDEDVRSQLTKELKAYAWKLIKENKA